MKKASFFVLCLLGFVVCTAEVVVERTPDTLVLKNELTKLELNANDFSLKQLTDLRNGRQFVTEPGGVLFSLTGFVKNQKPPAWYVTPGGIGVPAAKFTGHEARKLKNGWLLRFRQAPLGNGTVNVDITVTLAENSSLFRWEISIANSSNIPLQQAIFPHFSGLGSTRPGSENTDYLAAPVYSGMMCKNPRSKNTIGPGLSEYPASGMTIQLLTYCDGQDEALYFASHDAENYRKTFLAHPSGSKKSFSEGIIHYADRPYNPGVWKLPYPIYWGPVQGDWYDTAKIYRSWAIRQPRWEKSLAERKDIPKWFRELPVWFQGNQWGGDADAMLGFADKIVKVREALGHEIGFHWYIWQKYIAHDYNYPDYFPARPGFAEAVKKVQAAGVRVMPYLNIHLCETQLPIWKEKHLEKAAKRNSTGELYRSYGVCGSFGKVVDSSAPVDVFRGDQKGRDMVPMCPGEKVWQDIMVDAAGRLVNQYGVDLIYYDETYVFAGICYARNHRHQWLGGTDHAEGIAEIHRRTHKLRPDGVITTGENLGESYIDVCSALINAHSDMRVDSLPIFQTVFADRTTEIGIFVNQTELASPDVFASKLAFMLIRGRQLGWFPSDQKALDIVNPKYAKQLEMLKKYCDLRLAALPYLYEGEMLRAPDTSALPQVTRRWEIWPSFTEKIDYKFPVVCAGMFRAPDQSLGMALGNVTDQSQTVEIPWNAKDWGIAPGTQVQISTFENGKWGKPLLTALPERLKISVPPYSPALVKISTP